MPDDPLALKDDFNRSGFKFILVELDTALTFAEMASQAGADDESRARNRRNARSAYDTVVHLCRHFVFTRTEMVELRQKFKVLKAGLESLGEEFDEPGEVSLDRAA